MNHQLKFISLIVPLLSVGCLDDKGQSDDPIYFDRWIEGAQSTPDQGAPLSDVSPWSDPDAAIPDQPDVEIPDQPDVEIPAQPDVEIPAQPDAAAPDFNDLAEEPPLTITFIDVGQGDAVLLELPTDEAVLVDGGDNGHGEDDILPVLAEKGIGRLELMMLSHPHADHAGGLDEVLEALEVAEIWESGETSDSQTYEDFAAARDLEGAVSLVPQQGFIRRYGAVTLEVLNTGGDYSGEYNNNSLVVMVSYGNTTFLLTGDIEIEEQRDLISDYGSLLSADLLKVPHHGSYLFDTDFITTVRPEMAVISAGEGNRYEHPHQETLDAYYEHGARVCRTDLAGEILAYTYGDHFEYECAFE